MFVFVRDLAGRTFPFTLEPEADVAGLKAQIEESQGVSAKKQNLAHAGRALEDSEFLSENMVSLLICIHLL